jgi:hypothetical protein
MNRGIVWIVTFVIFGLHTNVQCKAIFKINIINFLIIYVVIEFDKNHHKKFG